MICIAGADIQLKNVQFQQKSDPAIRLLDSRRMTFDRLFFTGKTTTALKIEGARSAAIRFLNTDLTRFSKPVDRTPETAPDVLIK